MSCENSKVNHVTSLLSLNIMNVSPRNLMKKKVCIDQITTKREKVNYSRVRRYLPEDYRCEV